MVSNTLNPLHIAIIDDSKSILSSVSILFKHLLSHTDDPLIDTFETVGEFIKKRKSYYDIAVIDWNLPDGKGRDIVSHLNGDCPYKIIYTGMTDDNMEISEYCIKNKLTYIPKGSTRKDLSLVGYVNKIIERISRKVS